MALTKAERDWLEEKFTGVHTKLEFIKEQVTKTNGRVNDLEDNEKDHYLKCPNTSLIAQFKQEQDRWYLFKKYPVLTAIIIFAIGAITTLTIYNQIQ